ncbi:hypothetical protein GY21_17130 [Cryobacterium roopkundense]|uniref:Gram-positive cocci surface proteins LPxTG domain-containing protein n=1 Tax=Cryobacterium roopkundense TaxID=1001240 RepID=A0A099J3T9_9MICO|nr:hypothetical protein [Cryobacterium roopkundense]KGJ72187.1 hypothetical protein GY21_17130 [Cryobacterium roopkundense]MBB5642353.1 hypothetical protein [Cryobacterium roopkundense]
MVRKTFAAVALAGLVFFAVPSVANAATYVPSGPASNSTSTGTGTSTLPSTGTDAATLLMWPAVGALALGLGLVSVPIIRRRARA